MKITLFTSNQSRHNYLTNLLASICDELYVVQENKSVFSRLTTDSQTDSEVMKTYVQKVASAQLKLFGNSLIDKTKKNIKLFPIQEGELNKTSLNLLKDFLESDYYIIFGSSFIKGDLIDFLIQNKAINIHMGVSPYYRGTDCNFWALYDNNPHLVGATIHMLSKELDNGPILYHAMSDLTTEPFEYTMSAVKSAFNSIVEKVRKGSIFKIKSEIQIQSREIRYSKKKEFNEEILNQFFKKNINLKSKKIDLTLLKNPYFLSN